MHCGKCERPPADLFLTQLQGMKILTGLDYDRGFSAQYKGNEAPLIEFCTGFEAFEPKIDPFSRQRSAISDKSSIYLKRRRKASSGAALLDLPPRDAWLWRGL